MRTELVTIPTPTTPLDGAWHLPDEGKPILGACLLFHGNTMNFYTGAPRFLPPALTELGYACLAFNRRGHDILAIRDSRAAEGAAFQTNAEGIEDNNLASDWVKAKGFADPIVIGHSNGGMLAVKHVADHPETRALVLLSGHTGGKNHLRRSGKVGLLGGDKTEALIAEAEKLIAEGRGKEFILLPGWWYVATAESFIDRLHNMPPALEQTHLIKCPVLFIRGDEEDPDNYPAETFAAAVADGEAQVVPNCNHFYVGREDEVTARVVDWFKRRLVKER
jgi:pimeloyl-ACP methyl ester carboxylesterase